MCSLNKVQMEKGQEGKKYAQEIIVSRGTFLFRKVLKIILPACLVEITGWFRLFQSTGEIKAACIYFYLFLLWTDWAVSVGRLPVGLGRLNPGVSCSLGSAQELHPSVALQLEMSGTSLESSDHCAGQLSVWGAHRRSDPLQQSPSRLAVVGRLSILVLPPLPVSPPSGGARLNLFV